MRILYLHGLHSRPGGAKPTFLREQGHDVINPGLPDDDFERSVRIAQETFRQCVPEVVVGSSRGGAVAINIDSADVPLILIAPAWKRWGTASTVKPQTTILHSANDAVISIAESRALVESSGLEPDALVEVGQDHNMLDRTALEALLAAIERVGRRPGS